MSAENDYYAILGVRADADQQAVRRAFRERVRACHPDRVANLDEDLRRLAQEKMVQLNEAYAVLRDPARRAAYDERREGRLPEQPSPGPPTTGSRTRSDGVVIAGIGPRPGTARRRPRNRMADRAFVTRAASEEFTTRLREAMNRAATWTPVDLPGATLALRATHGCTDDYFALLAAPNLDRRVLRRFLKRLEAWSDKLGRRWFGRERVYPFAGALEFEDVPGLLRVVERYNDETAGVRALAPATLVDLVDWTVEPGAIDLSARLSALLD